MIPNYVSDSERSNIPPHRRERLHPKELSAIQFTIKSFNMIDKDVWIDFMMKLDRLASTPGVTVEYTPYRPDAEIEEDRGFKALIQVSCKGHIK